MCPPIQPRGVENRAAALLRGVNRLGSLTEQTCNVSWPSGILDEMNMHYQVSCEHIFWIISLLFFLTTRVYEQAFSSSVDVDYSYLQRL